MKKSYTDVEQSKKLAEVLPLRSADMCYVNNGTTIKIDAKPYRIREAMWKDSVFQIIPCWSLPALFDILAEQRFIIKSLDRNDEYKYLIDVPSKYCKVRHTSLLDAAFELVYWINKHKDEYD